MSDNPILGIDLGTTNSLAAIMTPSGPEIIRDSGGKSLVPSVIAFADGKVTVGAEARAHAVENPTATVYSVKRLMGKSVSDLGGEMDGLPYEVVPESHDTVCVNVQGRPMTPQELSAIILRDIKARAEADQHHERETQGKISRPVHIDRITQTACLPLVS